MFLPLTTGDVVVEMGLSLLSRLIRWFSRGRREAKAWASHAGHMHDSTQIAEAGFTFLIRALDFSRLIRVYRFRAGFTETEKQCIREQDEHWRGKLYGFLKVAAHAGDCLLEKLPFVHSVYLFRRLCLLENYPICSWATAWTFYRALDGFTFGVPPNAATPDDIADWCEDHPDEWECVYDNLPGVERARRNA